MSRKCHVRKGRAAKIQRQQRAQERQHKANGRAIREHNYEVDEARDLSTTYLSVTGEIRSIATNEVVE